MDLCVEQKRRGTPTLVFSLKVQREKKMLKQKAKKYKENEQNESVSSLFRI
jgi:hypothetical protein